MTDFFNAWYRASIYRGGGLFERFVRNSLHRRVVEKLANFTLPIYYRVTKNRYKLTPTEGKSPRIILSLTSFPPRIKRLWLVVESLLRQSYRPDVVVLWLSKEQFPDISALPKELLAQQSRGLRIEFKEGDLKPHKKYHYALAEYAEDIVITVDDDIFYKRDIISMLVERHRSTPDSIIANRARSLSFTDTGELAPYNSWSTSSSCSDDSINMQTGIGGVLYPPHSLYGDVLDIDLALKLAPKADDLWLFTMVRLNSRRVCVTDCSTHLLPVLNRGDKSLNSYNITESGNDIQIRALREYYMAELGIDPFAR
ncbi:MAG: hypothetical protein SNJ33_00570 [Rikenellaceae bacterium]